MKKGKQKIILMILMAVWWLAVSAYENGYLDFLRSSRADKGAVEVRDGEEGFCSGRGEKLVTIKQVFDGDTYGIVDGGKEDKVRLVGINTPEKKGPYREEECYGKEATQYAQKWQGKEVCFIPDGGGVERDKYERLLGYLVQADGGDIGADLIKNGYGQVYVFRGRDFRNKNLYQQQEKAAREHQLGLWSVCKP